MMHGKAIWKPEVDEITKASRGIAPGPHKGGLHHPAWTLSCNDQHADTHRVMSYSHKTQSFMTNKGEQ